MPVNILGKYPVLIRKRTGLFSLDMALRSRGELGFPLRTITELYGRPESGKSTLAYYLAGKITESGKISVCDVDKMMDFGYIQRAVGASGFSGDVHIIDATDEKGKPVSHEKMLMNMIIDLREEETGAAIIDSVGAIQPQVELEENESFGQAFMGKRAKLVAQVARATSGVLRDKERPSIAIAINHYHAVVGGMGHLTPGGETLKHKATTRILIWTDETLRDSNKNIQGFVIKGLTEKHTFGGKGKKFTYVVIPDYGVHVGASAMFDCFTYGLAERKARVKVGDRSVGYLNADLMAAAADGNSRKFNVFHEALAEYEEAVMKGDANNVDDGQDNDRPAVVEEEE